MSVNDKIRFDYRLVNPRWKYESMSNYYILRLFCVCVCVYFKERRKKRRNEKSFFFFISLPYVRLLDAEKMLLHEYRICLPFTVDEVMI